LAISIVREVIKIPGGRNMKTRVVSPLDAAVKTGGCTFEPEIGWWTYTPESTGSVEGKKFAGVRDALYIPTLQKAGHRVAESEIESLKATARSLGFTNLACARGMWILSETGEPQVEVIWIAWANRVAETVREQLAALANHIKVACNQDCVAWEQAGDLKFTG
jgi:hypothetical protein